MSVELHDQTLLKVMKTENEGREYSVSFRAIVAQFSQLTLGSRMKSIHNRYLKTESQ